MIVKPLKISKYILQMEALNRRLPQTHPKKSIVNSRARNLRAGHNGEAALEFPLSFLPENDFLIFYNLRIPDSHGAFQIDILLVSSSFILIIEAKNIDGEVLYDDMGQSLRIKNDKVDAFANPIEQVKLQHLRLLRWLRQFHLSPIPIEKIVVYSSLNTILKNLTNNKVVSEMVMHKEKLLSKIETYKNMHPIPTLSEPELMDLSTQLLSSHTEEDSNAMEKYNISYHDLIKGVICPACGTSPMVRVWGKWKCNYCQTCSKTAHQHDLKDYALLIGEYINNKSVRDFLQLESVNTAKNILKEEAHKVIGTTSTRKYQLNFTHNRR